jgi:dienelactone hydrolase
MGGSKEQCLPVLRALAARGLPAVSFDAVEHGGRATRPPMALMAAVQADPPQLWAILGGTALDAPRVLDWAADRVGGSDVLVAGGVSLGGSIAVAAAGIDERIARVGAAVATPDWSRATTTPLPDAEPDDLRDRLEPMRNLERYRRDVRIAFECGGADRLVPPELAERFKERLAALDPAAGARVTVRLHPGLDHFAGAASPTLLGACVDVLAGEPDAT